MKMKTSEQRKLDNLVSDLIYGKMVDLGSGEEVVKSYENGGSDVVYAVVSNGKCKWSFDNPYHALNFVMGVLPE